MDIFNDDTYYNNLFSLAQNLQKRSYNYQSVYTKQELEECSIPHLKERCPDAPEHRIQLLEYNFRRNISYSIFLDFYKRKAKGYSSSPTIELPPIQFLNTNPTETKTRQLYIYETEILRQSYGYKIVVCDKQYDMLKDMDPFLKELPPIYYGASLELLTLTIGILASRLEYKIMYDYNPDDTIKRIYFTNYERT